MQAWPLLRHAELGAAWAHAQVSARSGITKKGSDRGSHWDTELPGSKSSPPVTHAAAQDPRPAQAIQTGFTVSTGPSAAGRAGALDLWGRLVPGRPGDVERHVGRQGPPAGGHEFQRQQAEMAVA